MANQLTINKYRDIIKELNISCDYEVLANTSIPLIMSKRLGGSES